jgi:hypothetical protein
VKEYIPNGRRLAIASGTARLAASLAGITALRSSSVFATAYSGRLPHVITLSWDYSGFALIII